MGHRFGVCENWVETEGKLKYGFAQGQVQTIVLSMPFFFFLKTSMPFSR